MSYACLEEIVVDSFSAMRPPERLTVTECAEKYHIVQEPGSHSGPWSRDLTPYVVEVQDTLNDIEHEIVAFAAPARTGKSMGTLNWIFHTAMTDPSDLMVVHMAQHTGRDWVKTQLERSLRHSPKIRELLSKRGADDNLFDKQFLSGMRLTTTWPTAKNLSGKTVRRKAIMDRDRIADDIDGEGDPLTLTHKRGATFRRFNKTYVEGSPGRDVTTPNWLPSSPHEAPPTTAILATYNLGDRRCWYWACPSCGDAFEPRFDLLKWPDGATIEEAAQATYMICPRHGCVIEPDMKEGLNRAGRWVRDGMMWLPGKDVIVDRPGMRGVVSNIASFWLKGPAAGFVPWSALVRAWLQAQDVYEKTGDESLLRATTNTDQGMPYVPRMLLSDRTPEALREKAEDWGSDKEAPTVPPEVRFLVATIDVQARSFVVQVHGFAPSGDVFLIDYFKIRISERLDAAGRTLPVEPAAFIEDWRMLIPQVVEKTYPLADDSGGHMGIVLTGCDSGGREGVTAQAYNFWRELRKAGAGLHRRFALVKGSPSPATARATVSWPDSSQRGNRAVARGDVPVVLMNSNLLKDQVAGMLSRRTSSAVPGGGMIRYPIWTEGFIFEQLCNEVRNDKGVWEMVKIGRRNEAFDLAYYAIGLAVRAPEAGRPVPYPALHISRPGFWETPPPWADEWSQNELVAYPEVEGETPVVSVAAKPASDMGALFRELGDKLA